MMAAIKTATEFVVSAHILQNANHLTTSRQYRLTQDQRELERGYEWVGPRRSSREKNPARVARNLLTDHIAAEIQKHW